MAELETAREFCDRVPRELGLVDFNSFEARRHLEKRLAERDKAVALRVLTDIRDAANAALKGKGLSMSPAKAIANAWQAAFDKYQEKP